MKRQRKVPVAASRAVSSRATSRRAVSRKKPKTRSAIAIKRAYDAPAADDGLRILVDRLWPRGIAKAKLKVDGWPKHVAPSTELRRWYHAAPRSFAEFRRRYLAELEEQGESLDELRTVVRGRKVTLITGVREPASSHAKVLCEALQQDD
jgi:uncharacterized protein YeaO (DUF488 family)